jgi:hypothetical protein
MIRSTSKCLALLAIPVVLTLSGCVFAVSAVPDENSTSKRVEQLEERVAKLEASTVKKRGR